MGKAKMMEEYLDKCLRGISVELNIRFLGYETKLHCEGDVYNIEVKRRKKEK